MDSILVWLLNNRVVLGRIVIITTIVPFYLATISLLSIPMLLAASMLFLTLNWSKINKYIIGMLNAHIWLKIQYFWFIVGSIVFSILVYTNLKPFVPISYFVGTIYLLLNIVWINKLNTMMVEDTTRIILKGETTETASSKDVEPYLFSLVLTLMIVFLISSLVSIVRTRARSIFTIEAIHWYFPLVILIVYFSVDMIFVEQIKWKPSGGTTTWKPRKFNLEIPNIHHPEKLKIYFEEAGKLPTPPDGVKDFINENLVFFVEEAQNLDYFPFQINYVTAMENWGREGRDQIHLMLSIVLASISQYRFSGLIPLYKRKMFYRSLEVIAMAGSMTVRWRELIEYEVISKKDKHYVLDWVLGSRYLDYKYQPDWLISWEGKIYKGKAGYYEAVRKMEHLLQIRPQMKQWELDIWDLCFNYSQVFIGENSRELFSKNVKFYDQLLFMADGKTSKDYLQAQKQHQEQLMNPSNRLVMVHEEKTINEYSEEEKSEIVKSYLSSEPVTTSPSSSVFPVKTLISFISKKFSNIEGFLVLKIIAGIGLFFFNIMLIWLIDQLVEDQIGVLIIAIQVFIFFIYSITPSDSDLNLDDKYQKQSTILSTTVSTQSAININTSSIRKGTFYLLYGIGLLVVYQVLYL